jgi:predicted TPR repeat methyltransferase
VALEERGELENAAEKYRLAAASLPEASFNLGNVMIALGRDADGIAAYREAVAARPGYARALSNLGGALQRLGELDAAAQTYRELLAVEPDDVEALHMVAALTGERRERADAAYVAKFFDEYAEEFEHTLVDGLGYKTPAEVATLVARHRPPRGSFVRALDLGCGTGLAGRAVRRECEVLIGVDISPNMLAKAREAGGYDELVVSDIGQFLERRGERFDLFIASDVLNYLGDLREPFRLVAARALPGALFVFSTEAGAEAVMLERTGRFSHGRSYVETMARETGFEVLGCQDEVLRKERGAAVRGHLFALRASAGA